MGCVRGEPSGELVWLLERTGEEETWPEKGSDDQTIIRVVSNQVRVNFNTL